MSDESTNDDVLVMGILNVTPDSFSDGGRYNETDEAVRRGVQILEEGADIVDVGGESTRPGSKGVSAEEELARVLPVIEGLVRAGVKSISIDTVKPRVARAAIDSGAGMINDVSTLRNGNELAEIAAESGARLVIMHSRKAPLDMQQGIEYGDVVTDVAGELTDAAERARSVGVAADSIWLDPGIGFAKTPYHNLQILARLREIVDLGYPVMVGPSRKSFISEYTGAPVDERMGGTAAAVSISMWNGASGVRVHDVAIMGQAARMAELIARTKGAAGGPEGLHA